MSEIAVMFVVIALMGIGCHFYDIYQRAKSQRDFAPRPDRSCRVIRP